MKCRHYIVVMVLTCLVVGLGLPAFPQVVPLLASTNAQSPATLLSQKRSNATTDTLLEQGKQRYESGQIVEAVQIWKAIATATPTGLRQQAVVEYYLAVAYQDLGQWQAVERAIAQAFNFLSSVDDPLLCAQLLNTQGSYQFRTGQTETALETWKRAEQRYRKLGDVQGIALSQINQAQALQVLGYYRQARRTLEQLRRDLTSLPDSLLKAKALQSLGVTLQAVGDVEQSRVVLFKSLAIAQRLKGQPEEAPAAALSKLNATSAIAETLLQLGNIANAQGDVETALTLYQQARATAPRSQTWLEASLNQLKLLITDGRFEPVSALTPEIEGYLESLSASRAGVYAQVNFAETMMLGVREQNLLKKNGQIVKLAQLLARAVQQARSLKDSRAEAYALGQLGHLYEQNQQWADALNLTRQALQIGQQIQADDLAATWQWQQGRILKAQGDFKGAITAYSQSITLLQSLRQDLVAMPDVQFSFREQVEPVYRQLVQLLLRDVDRLPAQIQQLRLLRSREVIEALQLAELENFFREACLTYKPRSIDKIDTQAAVIYPILLDQRLEVILSLPNQPLQHYGTDLPHDAGSTAFRDLRQALIPAFPPSQVLPPAQQFYNWLIRPAEAALAQHQIKQLVFVLDGYLRSLPMAVLHDGKQYLIEKYSLALTPGLQLLNSHMRSAQQFRVLAGGITEARQGFPALPAVESEIAQIKAQLPTQTLLNRNFTDAKLQHEVTGIPFSIVHLATHVLPISRTNDVVSFTLPNNKIPLTVGKNYQWILAVICGESGQPDDPVFSGWVQRVNQPAKWQELSRKTPLQQAQWYGAHGYWYDMLDVIVQERRSHPNDATLAALWRDFIKSLQLDVSIFKVSPRQVRLYCYQCRRRLSPSAFQIERWEGLNYRICENCFKKLGVTTMNLQVENSIFETGLKVQQALQKREGGKTEYETLVGFADLVTAEYVIEIKHVSDWKEGLKVLAYQDQLPTRKPRIHLFGGHSQSFRELVEKTLTKLGVIVTWEEEAGT